MRRFAYGLTPVFVAALAFGCADDPEEPGNAFQTAGDTNDTNNGDSDTSSPPLEDLPSDDEVGDGDGDPDPTTTDGGDGDGDPDPTAGDGDGDPPPVGCGNGTVDDGEQCDGGNLGGFSCVDLGYSGGTLGCDPVTCTYDASGCVTNTDGNTTGGTTG